MLSDRVLARLGELWRGGAQPLDDEAMQTVVSFGLDVPPLGGRFRLLAPLASGGMGIVYRALDLQTGAEVAVKVPNVGPASFDRRFELEGDGLAAVVAPSIVRLIARGDAREPYLAMELVEGESLAKLIRAGARSRGEAVAIGRRLAAALAQIHARGWIHRDVKPGNVAVTREGEIRLLDFGLARPLEGAGAGTRTGDLVGTLSYLAPEQMGGARVVDARTDVFALGCVVFEVATGFFAFRRLTSEIVAGMWSPGRHPELDPEGMGLDRELGAVVSRLTAADPERRPADATEALWELAALDGWGGRLEAAQSFRGALCRAAHALRDGVAAIEGIVGRTTALHALGILLAELHAPARILHLRACPRAARTAGLHAVALEAPLSDAGHAGAASLLRGGAPLEEGEGEPGLVLLVDDADLIDATSCERLCALGRSGLARVVFAFRGSAPASFAPIATRLPEVAESVDRWDDLSPLSRWVLRMGAVFGTTFEAERVAALIGGEEAHLVGRIAEALAGSGLLRALGGGRYAFSRASLWRRAVSASNAGELRVAARLADELERTRGALPPEMGWVGWTSAVGLDPPEASTPAGS